MMVVRSDVGGDNVDQVMVACVCCVCVGMCGVCVGGWVRGDTLT